MAHQQTDQDEPLNEVNVIPLADLSLVLLIILMVLTPMVSQALIQVTAAKATAAQHQEELPANPETPVMVSLQVDGIRLNGEVITSDLMFAGKLEALLMKRRDRTVNLTASPDVLHGEVVHLMDIIRRHGATELVMLKWDPSMPGAGGTF